MANEKRTLIMNNQTAVYCIRKDTYLNEDDHPAEVSYIPFIKPANSQHWLIAAPKDTAEAAEQAIKSYCQAHQLTPIKALINPQLTLELMAIQVPINPQPYHRN